MKLNKGYKAIISDSAKADIKDSAKWYNKQQKGLGKRFTQSIKKCIKDIQQHPEGFQVRYKNCRIGIPEKFPYLVIYNIDNDNKVVVIIVVFHSSKNPQKWESKL